MILKLYNDLRQRHGARSDPATWWPIFYGDSTPPEFERVITNVLVQNSNWKHVPAAVQALHNQKLLTAHGLATAPLELIAECIKPTGLQLQKAQRLKGLCSAIIQQFGSEQRFVENVSRSDLLQIPGIGQETADRILLYACNRLAWPVDTYCFRVFAHHGILEAVPTKTGERRRCAEKIKAMVAEKLPQNPEDLQRLHALMMLEGQEIRPPASRAAAG
jgi:endonuclease-3 related protein